MAQIFYDGKVSLAKLPDSPRRQRGSPARSRPLGTRPFVGRGRGMKERQTVGPLPPLPYLPTRTEPKGSIDHWVRPTPSAGHPFASLRSAESTSAMPPPIDRSRSRTDQGRQALDDWLDNTIELSIETYGSFAIFDENPLCAADLTSHSDPALQLDLIKIPGYCGGAADDAFEHLVTESDKENQPPKVCKLERNDMESSNKKETYQPLMQDATHERSLPSSPRKGPPKTPRKHGDEPFHHAETLPESSIKTLEIAEPTLIPLSPSVEVHRKSQGRRVRRHRCTSYFDEDILRPSESSDIIIKANRDVGVNFEQLFIRQDRKENKIKPNSARNLNRAALHDHPLEDILTQPVPFCKEAEDFKFVFGGV
ncbi:MAG: hypothetical protein M4579_004904 [Chaenotheca gracillima]|nr:MAG: hypothetical protein M4579_004904 [Chaenotheca gracillima]